MKIVPAVPSLVVLIGPSGAGKSTLISDHFDAHEVVSSDALREELTGSFLRQDKNSIVFQEFHRRIGAKIAAGQRVVADATHIKNSDRCKVANIGRELGVPVVYLVVNRPLEDKISTGGWRTDIIMTDGISLIEAHERTFCSNEKEILKGDGIADMVIDTRTEEFRVIKRFPVDSKKVIPFLHEQGFSKIRVIGDVHGNTQGLRKALDVEEDTFFLLLGDVLDYGDGSLETTKMVYDIVYQGRGIMIRGNHEAKILRFVVQERGSGFRGILSHGNTVTTDQLKILSTEDKKAWEDMFIGLVEMSPDIIQIGNKWMFAHAAVHRHAWNSGIFRANRNSAIESHALYGQTTGEFVDGYPVRKYDWVDELPEGSTVVVGHAILSIEEPVVMTGKEGGKAIFLDTGSSKEQNGELGHLSWIDLSVDEQNDDLVIIGHGEE